MREYLNLIEETTRPAKLETTPLPYGPNDLEPVMSKATLDYHFEHLAKGYAKRYNAGEGNDDFNRAGSYLHNKFFPQFRKPKSGNRPKGASAELIQSKFKTFELPLFGNLGLGLNNIFSLLCFPCPSSNIRQRP